MNHLKSEKKGFVSHFIPHIISGWVVLNVRYFKPPQQGWEVTQTDFCRADGSLVGQREHQGFQQNHEALKPPTSLCPAQLEFCRWCLFYCSHVWGENWGELCIWMWDAPWRHKYCNNCFSCAGGSETGWLSGINDVQQDPVTAFKRFLENGKGFFSFTAQMMQNVPEKRVLG